MNLYIDSSVLVAILLNEPTKEHYQKLTAEASELWSSFLLEAEVYSAVARENVTVEVADRLLGYVALVMPERSLKEEYRFVFSKGYCRGGDAYHLATLLYLDPQKSKLALLTADERQKEVALKIGIRIA